jgi:hypothetical protein
MMKYIKDGIDMVDPDDKSTTVWFFIIIVSFIAAIILT